MDKWNIFETLLEPVFIVNSSMQVVYCNPPASVLADVSPRKIVKQQRTLPDLFKGFVMEKPVTEINEQTTYKETTLFNAAETEYRVQWTLQPIEDQHWLVYFRDVTLEATLQRKYRGELEQKEEYINELKKAKQELEHYSKNLEEMVAARTAQIQSMNKTMQALLDSLHQGFFIFSPNGNILPVFSKACNELFGKSPTGVPVWDYLGMTEKEKPGFQKWMSTVFMEMLPFEDLAPLGPTHLSRTDDRTVKLEYYPLRGEESGLEAVVVMATDITALVEAQKEAAREKTYAQFILKLIQSQKEVLRFVRESKTMIDDIKTFMAKPWPEVDTESFYRLLHTLKGGSASFSGEEIAMRCHAAEGALSELQYNPDAQLMEKLKEQIVLIEEAYNKYAGECHKILGPYVFSSERHLQIPESELLKMVRDLRMPDNSAPVAERIMHKYLLEPLSGFFFSYDESLQKLAERLEKNIAPLKIINGEVLVWGDYYQSIFATFVHLFRNALDHGIETPHERAEAGKSP
ncbi:MAG: Hpt domain-containing protein, partial [Bdellovibrionota bacterium]